MLDTFQPELVGLLTLALIVLGTLAILFFRRVIEPRILESDFYKRYGVVLEHLDDVVSDVVMRLAFSDEDLSHYRAKADETGRDVRLVAALDLVDRYTTAHGIDLDEELIISKIEARLANYKRLGLLDKSGRNQ